LYQEKNARQLKTPAEGRIVRSNSFQWVLELVSHSDTSLSLLVSPGVGLSPASAKVAERTVFVRATKEIGAMDKPAQNIQDSFLNSARKEKTPITIYLLSGVKLTGRIRSFDKYSVVLDANGQEQLIFKHAISTLVMPKSHGERFGLHPAAEARPVAEPASEAAAAGSRGES
jgi:host factor-I protein